MRRQPILAGLWCLVFWGLPLAAQTPSFLIESIQIQNTSPQKAETIESVSMLVSGISYNESELNQALSRIRKLPYVYDCRFSLAKGSRRGLFQLVIWVEESLRLTFAMDGLGIDNIILRNEDFGALDFSIHLNYLWLSGRNTIGYASVGVGLNDEPDYSGSFYTVGLSHYNVFNRNVFANINYTYLPGEDTEFERRQQHGLFQIGLPFRAHHWFRAEVAHNRIKRDFATFIDPSDSPAANILRKDWNFGLSWEYNTIDDPQLPTSGQRLSSQIAWRHRRSILKPIPPNGDFTPFSIVQKSLTFFVEGQQHFQMTRRQIVSLGGALGVGGFDFQPIPGIKPDEEERRDFFPDDINRLDREYGHVRLNYTLRFGTKRGRGERIRMEIGSAYEYDERPKTLDSILNGRILFGTEDKREQTISAGVVWRSKWAFIRFSLFYSKSFGDLDLDIPAEGVQ